MNLWHLVAYGAVTILRALRDREVTSSIPGRSDSMRALVMTSLSCYGALELSVYYLCKYNDSGQAVRTHVPQSPSSLICYWSKLGR